ncbi:rhomboid family intramembrane serine protease [bacterium]|nr:rhomboid family intramembrane serine protease [bacterium]
MRHIGSLKDEAQATRFGAYMTTKAIKTSVDPEGDEWAVWIHNEDQLDQGREELKTFLNDPNSDVYQKALVEADRLEKAAAKKAKKAAKKVVNARDRWDMPMHQQCPVTASLIGLSIIAVMFTTNWFEWDMWNLTSLQMPITGKLLTASFVTRAGWIAGLAEIMAGQVWRLVTPIFLHFDILHILFNMMWLQRFGLSIEFVRGKFRFLLLVLTIAVISNLAQYLMSGPVFGGMSGVNYGLFGFLWMKSKYDPNAGFYMDPNLAMWFMIFAVVCLTGSLGPIANSAHFGGLICGGLIALAPVAWRKLT